jgi:hypothetical protein
MGILLFLSKSGASTGLDCSEILLLVFGLMVAIGVLGESTKSEKWKKWHRTFELLVIIGVAGELFADGTIFIFSKHLQTISDSELTAAIRKAGDAELSADKAADAADRANTSSQKADREAKHAELAAEKVNALAADAEARTLRTDQALGELKRPRIIKREALERMAKDLGEFPGTPFDLNVAGDGEPIRLMDTVRSMLAKAGWKQVPVTGRIGLLNSDPFVGLTTVDGILVEISGARPDLLKPSNLFIWLLDAEHLDVFGLIRTDLSAPTSVLPNAIHISIGKKPTLPLFHIPYSRPK